MKSSDQLYRNGSYKENKQKQDSIDLLNARELKNIFETYGFPSDRVIGNYTINDDFVNIDALLLHTKDSIRRNYFIPTILKYVRQGKANPRYVGFMEDQLLIYAGKEQYYGTYQNAPLMSVDTSEINKRRQSIGLPNLGYEQWRDKILYPDESEY
ncbi:MAG: hypothetical protein AAF611_07905 [Bacteroidota bacterium]